MPAANVNLSVPHVSYRGKMPPAAIVRHMQPSLRGLTATSLLRQCDYHSCRQKNTSRLGAALTSFLVFENRTMVSTLCLRTRSQNWGESSSPESTYVALKPSKTTEEAWLVTPVKKGGSDAGLRRAEVDTAPQQVHGTDGRRLGPAGEILSVCPKHPSRSRGGQRRVKGTALLECSINIMKEKM